MAFRAAMIAKIKAATTIEGITAAMESETAERRGFTISDEKRAEVKQQIAKDFELHGFGPHWIEHRGVNLCLKRCEPGHWCGYVLIDNDAVIPAGATAKSFMGYIEDGSMNWCFHAPCNVTYGKVVKKPQLDSLGGIMDPCVNRNTQLTAIGFHAGEDYDVKPNFWGIKSGTAGKDSAKYPDDARPTFLMDWATYKDYEWCLKTAKKLADAVLDYVDRINKGLCPFDKSDEEPASPGGKRKRCACLPATGPGAKVNYRVDSDSEDENASVDVEEEKETAPPEAKRQCTIETHAE